MRQENFVLIENSFLGETKGPNRLAVFFLAFTGWWSDSEPSTETSSPESPSLSGYSDQVVPWDFIVPHPRRAPRHGKLTLMMSMDSGTHYRGWCPWKMCNLAMKLKSRRQAAFTHGLDFIRCLPLSRHPRHHICSSCKQVPST